MSHSSFLEQLQNHAEINRTAQELSIEKTKIHWHGILGSAKGIYASAVASQCPGHHVFVLNDKEEAAYFLNDLQGIYPEDPRLVFYPASYKVPYQLEEVDNANVVARTEALKKLSSQENCWIITYPEALFEKVLTKKHKRESGILRKSGQVYRESFLMSQEDFLSLKRYKLNLEKYNYY